MKLWRADFKQVKPVLVDCPNGSHPHDDADGVKIFDNTHFEKEGDAWKHIEETILTRIEMFGRWIVDAENELSKFQKQAAEAAKDYSRFVENKGRDV